MDYLVEDNGLGEGKIDLNAVYKGLLGVIDGWWVYEQALKSFYFIIKRSFLYFSNYNIKIIW